MDSKSSLKREKYNKDILRIWQGNRKLEWLVENKKSISFNLYKGWQTYDPRTRSGTLENFLSMWHSLLSHFFTDQLWYDMKNIFVYIGIAIVYDYHHYEMMLQMNNYCIQTRRDEKLLVVWTGSLTMHSTILFSLYLL